VSAEGPDHDKQFVIAVIINGEAFAQGGGKSKQAAQQQAASLALEKLQSTNQIST
jgi:ribonuclease-3